jgi:hypothetical protein
MENEKLTFGELKRGDMFIAFPRPGDNSGHGGYKGTHWIYYKCEDGKARKFDDPDRYTKFEKPDGVDRETQLPDAMEVIKVG